MTNWLGDAVMSLPAVAAIKRAHPDARLAVLTRNKLSDLWKTVPQVDEVISASAGESVFSVASKIAGKFDLAVVFPNSVRAALEVFLARIPRRVGYHSRWRRWLINEIVAEPSAARPPEHQMHRYLRLAESLGADTANPVSIFSPENTAATGDGDGAIKIGICPGADYGAAKRWLPERFAAVAREAVVWSTSPPRSHCCRACRMRARCRSNSFGTTRSRRITRQMCGRSSRMRRLPPAVPTALP